jgi:hypothetical protein
MVVDLGKEEQVREVRAWTAWVSGSTPYFYSKTYKYYYWPNKSTPPTVTASGSAINPNFSKGDWTLLGEASANSGGSEMFSKSGDITTFNKPVVATFEPKIFRYIMLEVNNDVSG